MNGTKIIAVIIVLCLVGGGVYLFLNQTPKTPTGQAGILSLMTYDDAVTQVGFSINKDCVVSGQRSVTGYISSTSTYSGGIHTTTSYGSLKQDYYSGISTVTISCGIGAVINWEKNILGIATGWHQISQWWYTVNFKDKYTAWHPISGGGIDISRKTFNPKYPDTLGNPPHYLSKDFSFTLNTNDNSKDGAVRVETFVKLDTGEEFKVQSEEAYVVHEKVHLIVHTNPLNCDVVQGVPTSSGGQTKQTINSGAQGVVTFYPTTGQCFIRVSKEGYQTYEEVFELTEHKEMFVTLKEEGVEPPPEPPSTMGNLTIYTNPANSQVSFSGQNYIRKIDASTWRVENIEFGLYEVFVQNWEWKSYDQRKWLDENVPVQINKAETEITVTLQEDSTAPNERPMAYKPVSQGGVPLIAYDFNKFFVETYDAEGDQVRNLKIDWGDGNVQTKINPDTEDGMLVIGHSYLRAGTFEARVQASQVGYQSDAFNYFYSAGKSLDESFNWGDWSESLTVDVERKNFEPTVEIFSPESGLSGAPGVVYKFTASGSDADGDTLRYKFHWGDGTESGWMTNNIRTEYRRYLADYVCQLEHYYSSAGVYTIAVDVDDGKTITTNSVLTDLNTAKLASGFTVAQQKLPSPRIDSLLLTGVNKTSTTVIVLNTPIPRQYFDVFVQVTDKSGVLVPWKAIEKSTFTGEEFVATISFTAKAYGDVTVTAKTTPKGTVTGFLVSDTVTMTNRLDRFIINIDANNCVKGIETKVTLVTVTGIPKDQFDVYAGVKDSSGIIIVPWASLGNKTTTDWETYMSKFYYKPNVTGTFIVSAQAIQKGEGGLKSYVISQTISCTSADEEKNDSKNPWDYQNDSFYNSTGGTPTGELYDASKNSNRLPGFEIIIVFFAIASLVAVRRWRKR